MKEDQTSNSLLCWLAVGAPAGRHLRLLHCQVTSAVLWHVSRALPSLSSLVVKEAPLAGVGSSGVAAVAGLRGLRALALTLEPLADVSCLGDLSTLR